MTTSTTKPTPSTKLSIERLHNRKNIVGISCDSLRVHLTRFEATAKAERSNDPYTLSESDSHVFSYTQQVNPTIGKFFVRYARPNTSTSSVSTIQYIEEVEWDPVSSSFVNKYEQSKIPIWVVSEPILDANDRQVPNGEIIIIANNNVYEPFGLENIIGFRRI